MRNVLLLRAAKPKDRTALRPMFTPGMRKAHEEYVERERKRYRRQRREYTKGERSAEGWSRIAFTHETHRIQWALRPLERLPIQAAQAAHISNRWSKLLACLIAHAGRCARTQRALALLRNRCHSRRSRPERATCEQWTGANLRLANTVAGWPRLADIPGASAWAGERSEGSEAGCMGQSPSMTESLHFVIAVWKTKEAESHRVKYWE